MVVEVLGLCLLAHTAKKQSKNFWRKTYPELAREIVKLLDENCGITATNVANYYHLDRSTAEIVCKQMVRENKMRKVIDNKVTLYFPCENSEKPLTRNPRCATM